MNSKEKNIGERLREICNLEYGGSTKRFASALGIASPQLSNLFSGRDNPGNKIWDRLAALGHDVEWIRTGKRSDERISDEQIKMIEYLNSIGIDSLEKAKSFFSPENIAQDIAFILREKLAEYKPNNKKG